MNNPLVSITIVTYNSSKYILDALESVKAQTYNNIELIVSDDCSTDNTIEIVNKWLNANSTRFLNVEVLSTDVNTGVSKNSNIARNACHGEWTKGFAGDDILLPTCIEDNLNFIENEPHAQVVLSNSIVFFDNGLDEMIQRPALLVPDFFNLSASDQYEKLVQHDLLMNPNSQFVKTCLLKSLKADERMKYMEDRQFFWNCTNRGVKIYYFDKVTVRYRKHEGALTGYPGKQLLSLNYNDSWAAFYYITRKTELEKRNINTAKDEKRILWYLVVKYILGNRGNLVMRILNRYVEKWIQKTKYYSNIDY